MITEMAVGAMNGVAVFDLDGCISDDRWRRRLLPSNPTTAEDWEAYHAGIDEDVLYNMDRILEQHNLGRDVVFFTARPEKYGTETADWLRVELPGAVVDLGIILRMRPEGNEQTAPELKRDMAREFGVDRIAIAFDDRADVVEMYRELGIDGHILTVEESKQEKKESQKDAAAILENMAATYRQRNSVYGDNYRRVAPVFRVLFPNGVPDDLVFSDKWHLFELVIVKLTRFATSGLTHVDTIHDVAVYCAMIEAILAEENNL